MSKDEMIDKVSEIVESVKNGEKNALDVYPELYELQKSISEIVSELKDFVVQEREKYDKKERVIRNGYEIEVFTRASYSFKNDEHWESLKQSLKNRESMMKKAYKMSEKNKTLTDPETGEIMPLPEVKISTYPKLNYVGDKDV